MSVAELLEGRRICVCGGSGGVGKTTTAAAIAIGMAAAGARVAVVTIDPARRLADAFGLSELGNEPALVSRELFAAAGIEMQGELWAMMLDPKRTFDDLVGRLAPTAQARDEVLSNRIYREISNAVAGTQEYTAIAKLHQLHEDGGFDLIVLDTPPSRNALDFLDAPDRLTQFFEGRALQVFLRPTGLAGRVVGRGGGLIFSLLGRVTGVDVLGDVSNFLRAFGGMIDGFRDRARRVNELLRDPATTFLLVTSPEREPVDEAIFFWRKLREASMPYGGTIVNRVHHDYAGDEDPSTIADELSGTLGKELAGRVADNFRDYHVLARRDAGNIERLANTLDERRMLLVPQFDEDVHDLAGLRRMHGFLFASGDERRRMLDDVVA
ncbi:MAG TPA: ArsA-related P-loop ATPase [Solirubrobacteraceae bacterium]|nr:ArsA-related P-loop ATPase [Solirubrobacteraceae bacterium]